MDEKIGLKEAISIGVGGMVGGGIFAVFGLAAGMAKGGTPVSFLLAGILALITAHSYAQLSKAYPDRGGTVKFINQGFGQSVFSGAINNLLWISYIIMISLSAAAFGSYALHLVRITSSKHLDLHIYASSIIVLATFINYYSIRIVGRIESYAVIIKIVILVGFVFVGLYGLRSSPHVDQLDLANWTSPVTLFAGGMVIFVAYEGFELIANAVPDMRNPEKNIARSYYISVIFVVILYIFIAIAVVGALPFNEIASAQDYVLAEAARPTLGGVGFTVIAVAALIATFSAINASLYGSSRVNLEIAQDHELPHYFLAQYRNQPIGLLITAILTLILVNVLDLESISTTGSVGFLLIFGVVNLVAFKLAETKSRKNLIPLLGFIFCMIALVVLVQQQYKTNLLGVIVSGTIIVFCVLAEWIYKRTTARFYS